MENPSILCQSCRSKLVISLEASTANVFDSSKIDESFIVLDEKRPGAMGSKGMEESFIVLGSASGKMPGAHNQGGSSLQAPQNDNASFGLDAKLCALAQLFDMASTHTQVDHPLCLDCAAQLKDEIDAQIQDAEREIAAYSVAVEKLEHSNVAPLGVDEFHAEMAALKEAEEQESIDAVEERYWHDYNDYQLQLAHHIEERDGLLNKIDRASQRLQLLKNTNVYNDAFKIWHDGPFGTISGFRLGRTTEWDEINAAWGQAVLLLHTMSQACKLHFASCRLLPMGSHPRVVVDKRTTYDLFGPVNKLWSANYDRAMASYLACLREFGDFAHARDTAEGKQPSFVFPFPIEGDKVNNHTIKLTMNKDAKWTKALKFMLADLKVALQWMVKHELTSGTPTLTNLGHEGVTKKT
eukprot:gene21837-28869_t